MSFKDKLLLTALCAVTATGMVVAFVLGAAGGKVTCPPANASFCQGQTRIAPERYVVTSVWGSTGHVWYERLIVKCIGGDIVVLQTDTIDGGTIGVGP